jgi:hypothetical protein
MVSPVAAAAAAAVGSCNPHHPQPKTAYGLFAATTAIATAANAAVRQAITAQAQVPSPKSKSDVSVTGRRRWRWRCRCRQVPGAGAGGPPVHAAVYPICRCAWQHLAHWLPEGSLVRAESEVRRPRPSPFSVYRHGHLLLFLLFISLLLASFEYEAPRAVASAGSGSRHTALLWKRPSGDGCGYARRPGGNDQERAESSSSPDPCCSAPDELILSINDLYPFYQ